MRNFHQALPPRLSSISHIIFCPSCYLWKIVGCHAWSWFNVAERPFSEGLWCLPFAKFVRFDFVLGSPSRLLSAWYENLYLNFQGGQSEDVEDADDESDDDEVNTDKVGKTRSGKFVATLPNFASWYENQYRCATSRKSLIIILEDFEGFSSQILQDLISNLTWVGFYLPAFFISDQRIFNI